MESEQSTEGQLLFLEIKKKATSKDIWTWIFLFFLHNSQRGPSWTLSFKQEGQWQFPHLSHFTGKIARHK